MRVEPFRDDLAKILPSMCPAVLLELPILLANYAICVHVSGTTLSLEPR